MAPRRSRIPVAPNQASLFGEAESVLETTPKQRAAFIGALMPISANMESLVLDTPKELTTDEQKTMVLSRSMALGNLGKESQLESLVTNEMPLRNLWKRNGNNTPKIIDTIERKRNKRVNAARALFIVSTGKATLKEGVTLFDLKNVGQLDFGGLNKDKQTFVETEVEKVVQSLRGTRAAKERTIQQKQLKKLAKDNDLVLPKVK